MYQFHSDPGHAWLEVPMSELRALGIDRKISQYSYRSRDGRLAYLEEDCDAGLFVDAARLPRDQVEGLYYEQDCFVRYLPRFPAHTNHSAATFSAGAL